MQFKPRVKAPGGVEYENTLHLIRKHALHTVCEEAACPNIGECWSKRHATVMILGAICTRACRFCNVATGKPLPVDSGEPLRLAQAVLKLGLRHVVITSVDRDDLYDGGASHFAKCVAEIKKLSSNVTVEVLTPDFLGKGDVFKLIVDSKPEVFNHNIETVPRLYNKIRPKARYFNSLCLLKSVKQADPSIFTKSGLMVGLGEGKEDVLQVMDDLRSALVDFLTIGQYLRPTIKHATVDRYVTQEEFDYYKRVALSKGFTMVASSPLTRSSYHADDDFERLKANAACSV